MFWLIIIPILLSLYAFKNVFKFILEMFNDFATAFMWFIALAGSTAFWTFIAIVAWVIYLVIMLIVK